jgi:hypothetical protein
MAQRITALVLALGIAAAGGFGALVGVTWGFGFKCGDSCSSGPRWRDDPESWQWETFAMLGIAGFVCSLLFLAGVALGWRWFAAALLAGWGVLAGVFMSYFLDSGLSSSAGRAWAAVAALLLSGIAAIALRGAKTRS